MQEFQGWTPATVDNLTFDQLDIIFAELNDYRSKVPPLDATLERLRQVIFKFLGVKEQKSGADDVKQLKDFPVAHATDKEMEAWYKTKMKESFSKFIKKYRKSQKR